MKTLVIIPARAGSKGIPGKNKMVLNGLELYKYALRAALETSSEIDVIIASDDQSIIDGANSLGVNVFHRSVESATDDASINILIEDLLKLYDHDLLILMQPTSPCRSGKDIDSIINMFEINSKVSNVISVIPLDDIHPARMSKIVNNVLVSLDSAKKDDLRQSLNPVFLRNGCFYAIRRDSFNNSKKIIGDHPTPYIMDYKWWLNIDDSRDLIIAESIIKEWEKTR
ncbi:acylneuraminate cytidylyltransferase family protein [Flavobacteriaceae bacterium]|nr:acylneuraminate cytidylyltransferase family protein [Flavobacteriaceae bacterium]